MLKLFAVPPVLLAAAITLTPVPSLSDASYDKITSVMETKGGLHNNRLGALVGARAYCKLDYDPLFQSWNNRYGMNSKTPQVIWDQMIEVAKSTISDLEADSVSCSEAAKQSLMSRAE